MIFECLICKCELKSIYAKSRHIRTHHNMSLLEFSILYENLKIPTCKFCNNNCKHKKGIIFRKTCGDKKCLHELNIRRTHTSETKGRISKSMKKFLSKNKDKHTWKRNDKFISIPCEYLKKRLIENIKDGSNIESEYSIPESDRNYSIDIAIPEKKIAIEVNGNQHYDSNGQLKKYYLLRKNHIESVGWKVIDVPYNKVYSDETLSIILDIICNCNIIYKFEKYNKKKIEKFCECGVKVYKYTKTNLCAKCASFKKRKVTRPDKSDLINLIELNGYKGTARLYGVSDTTIKKWSKK